MSSSISFIDLEVGIEDHKIHDVGIVKDEIPLHTSDLGRAASFLKGSVYLCGHNIVNHDLKYLSSAIDCSSFTAIDTLYLSPLLFPRKPYHSLLKDDKLQVDQLNNPVNDCLKAEILFFDEINAFRKLPRDLRQLYCALLYPFEEFRGFFRFNNYRPLPTDFSQMVHTLLKGRICANARVDQIATKYPRELAYAVALINTSDSLSITPRWVLHQFPVVENIIEHLCGTPCTQGCPYCSGVLDIHKALRKNFAYPSFRTYEGEPLQERATQAAVDGKSLIAIFPTGGGKSITFQLPALMLHEAVRGLTVVISPLQSLMKDQVDNLAGKGITSAVTVNGLLSPLERKEALERVEDGSTALLYISPESLRSRSIRRILFSRTIVRFVIDEAHCFSAWGQDFRVDYLYIGDFIREYQEAKNPRHPIPVSCFTATAKPKVISDIRDYFKRKLGLDLEIFATNASRSNLHYSVLFEETEEKKYNALRSLISAKKCPTIVYVSSVRKTYKLAERLRGDGFSAEAYNGPMDPDSKIATQDAFVANKLQIIVATSAFGMGVDKSDVKLVIHYEISSSLENYIQEAGRAGRDPSLEAECYILFNNDDLDQHFLLLSQTKLSLGEIQQVWKAIKDNTQKTTRLSISPLELARLAGWDESMRDPETRVKTAITALETAGYIRRGNNIPQIFATSINANSMVDASRILEKSTLFNDDERTTARRILSSLISSRSVAGAQGDDAESRIDYLADRLGLTKEQILWSIQLMRQEGLLSDSQDLTAFIYDGDRENSALRILSRYTQLETFLIEYLTEEVTSLNLKEVNEAAINAGMAFSTVKMLRTLLYFLTIKKAISKQDNRETNYTVITRTLPMEQLRTNCLRRHELSQYCLDYLYLHIVGKSESDKKPVMFSLLELYQARRTDFPNSENSQREIEDALLYLSKIGALKLEGGFLVLYNAIEIERIVTNNFIRYKADDYRSLDEFYKQKIQQIHIVGEFANLMVQDYNKAMQYVQDYFSMDYKKFLAVYFKEEQQQDLTRNITSQKYNTLFGELSNTQKQIIDDNDSRYIVVAAGPGSGKTRILVHKLASLLLMEDVKQDQLLMLTFSRAAATEFKLRLKKLIGNAANYVDIKTFHSYCFDLLGKVGRLEGVEDIVSNAAEMIERKEVEPGKIAKTVLVIDEAQDMDANEYRLISALIRENEDMRIIAVGDDDQNIFAFRGSDSKYMKMLVSQFGATFYEMGENYRSCPNLVALSNSFSHTISMRMKQHDIRAVRNQDGQVKILRHHGKNMETALVNLLCQTLDDKKTAVLTSTNEQALLVLGLLRQRGIRAQLIQSLDTFKMIDLAEVRFFLKYIDTYLMSPLIPDELWDEAKSYLSDTYAESSCLDNCLNMIEAFESTQVKYRSDLEEFIRESNYEDFYSDFQGQVVVSTIHRSKGKEYNNIHLLLKGYLNPTEEQKRAIYVALTRARDNLYIHSDSDLFDPYVIQGCVHATSYIDYPAPKEIVLHLSYRDVHLDYFLDKKEVILKLRAGASLSYCDGVFTAELNGRSVLVARISKQGLKKVEEYTSKGYCYSSSSIRFIVAWQKKDYPTETAVLLPSMTFYLPDDS